MINWLTHNQFEEKWKVKHQESKDFMHEAFSVKLSLEYFQNHMPLEAFEEEIYCIGKGFYWFGEASETLFYVERVKYEDFSAVIFLPKSKIMGGWKHIKLAEKLSQDYVHNINWIFSREESKYSLFYKTKSITNQLHSSNDKKELNELREYLKQNGSRLCMCVALTEHFHKNWSASSITEPGCMYNSRSATENFVEAKLQQNPDIRWKITCSHSKDQDNYSVMRQDANGNIFHVEDFEYEVDAKFKVLEYEAKVYKQTCWVKDLTSEST